MAPCAISSCPAHFNNNVRAGPLLLAKQSLKNSVQDSARIEITNITQKNVF